MGQLTVLTFLSIIQGNFSGSSIPSELGKLTNLQQLTLYNNSLDGSIPSQLGRLTQLQRLRLQFNNLTGNIPSQLGLLSKLGVLVSTTTTPLQQDTAVASEALPRPLSNVEV